MKKLLMLIIVMFMVGCEDNVINEIPAVDDKDQLENVLDDTVYSYKEVSTLEEIYDESVNDYQVEVITNKISRVNNYVEEFKLLVDEVEFKKSIKELEYDFYLEFTANNEKERVYIDGLLENAKMTIIKEEVSYESISDISEVMLFVYEALAESNIWLDEYEVISEVSGYKLMRIKNTLYKDYVLEYEVNHNLYIPLIDHDPVFVEVTHNEEKIVEIVSYGYTEHLTTHLQFYNSAYYISYNGQNIRIDETYDIDRETLLELVTQANQDDLFLFAIILE